MFEYRLAGENLQQIGNPDHEVWSLSTLQPLAPGVLTPFSYSVLAEVSSRAWYQHYDDLGFEPAPRSRVVLQHAGRPYFNLTKSAQLEAEHAGIRPITLQINDQPVAVAAWEKPGFFAGLRTGRAQKRMLDQIETQLGQHAAMLEKARNWYTKTGELKWSQADILQVMEEIERVSMPSYRAYLAARRQLENGYNQLIQICASQISFPQSLNLINHAVCDVQNLVEAQMVQALLDLADTFQDDDVACEWLHSSTRTDAEAALPAPIANAYQSFMHRYGHRGAGEGEMSNPRWYEDPTPIVSALQADTANKVRRSAVLPSNGHAEKLKAIAGKEASTAASLLETIRQGLLLQSSALNAIAYITAGTRRWALAAGREAMADQRLEKPTDVFFYELEEIKQMMTGEWNVSAMAAIRQTAADRQAAYAAQLQADLPSDLLVGNAQHVTEAIDLAAALPGTEGQANGPLRRTEQPRPTACNGAIIGVQQLDIGWAILLPIANGLVAATGVPYDPTVTAGRLWHTPTLVGLGARYSDLVDGAHTELNVDEVLLEQ